jgi:hypothetical protein
MTATALTPSARMATAVGDSTTKAVAPQPHSAKVATHAAKGESQLAVPEPATGNSNTAVAAPADANPTTTPSAAAQEGDGISVLADRGTVRARGELELGIRLGGRRTQGRRIARITS